MAFMTNKAENARNLIEAQIGVRRKKSMFSSFYLHKHLIFKVDSQKMTKRWTLNIQRLCKPFRKCVRIFPGVYAP